MTTMTDSSSAPNAPSPDFPPLRIQGGRVPTATYRLQFNAGFTFADARALVPYLSDLGVSDLYASPIFKSRAGSRHGYDIADHGQLDPELGSEEDFASLAAALRERGMGLLLDVVPNHMGIADAGNSWWQDVLENGPAIAYAPYFDIDWHPAKVELENKVLLPTLEDQYGNVLESGKLRVSYEDGAFSLYYYQTRLPLAPRSYSLLLTRALAGMKKSLDGDNEYVQELQSILTALRYLPPATPLTQEKRVERNREKEVIKRRIAALCQACPPALKAVDEAVRLFNGTPGDPRSYDVLDHLMEEQPYRLAFWRVATDEINYRRFFDINELAAIRVELPEVFQATHDLAFRLLAEGKVTGLRIDHPDGLWDPPSYFRRIQEEYLLRRASAMLQDQPTAQPGTESLPKPEYGSTPGLQAGNGSPAGHRPLFVVAEKILSEGEPLPEDWAVCGTTGYDFLNRVNGLFVDTANGNALSRIYAHFSGRGSSLGDLVNASKKMIMLVSMAGEINALAHMLDDISEENRRYRDFTLNSLTFAIREVIAALPVYRTYVNLTTSPSERDQVYIEKAVAEARRRNPRSPRALFDFIRDTLLLKNLGSFSDEDRPKLVEFVMKFQQITGPVMAKGVEDTAFYVYNRLASLNEVGGNPGRFGTEVSSFHESNLERSRCWPHSLLATSTHDTKRSEDVRTRIDVLSEIPAEWRAALSRWSRINSGKKTGVEGSQAPDRNDEYLLYQTLIGAWPGDDLSREQLREFRGRIMAYMLKAVREAKVHTSWVNPNEAYEEALLAFVRLTLDDRKRNRFLEGIQAFQRRLAFYGRLNSLSQILLKMTGPGIPDFYQGTETWTLSLVDPDNRRAVDFARHRALLAQLEAEQQGTGGQLALARELLDSAADGRIKLYLTREVLHLRHSNPELFKEGAYIPLDAQGVHKEHVCAFARIRQEDALLVAVPRLVLRLTRGVPHWPLGDAVWGDSRITVPVQVPGTVFRNLLTGEEVRPTAEGDDRSLSLKEVFRAFPVAVLRRADMSGRER